MKSKKEQPKQIKKVIAPKATKSEQDRRNRQKEVEQTFTGMTKEDLKNLSENQILDMINKYWS